MPLVQPKDFPPEYFTAELWVMPSDVAMADRSDESSTATRDWPGEFGLISGYATTGEVWTEARNRAADQNLGEKLRASGVWLRRVEIASPDRSHREPSWAVALPFNALCELGQEFLQRAVYYVVGDRLYVSFCDARRQLVPVGKFRARVHWQAPPLAGSAANH